MSFFELYPEFHHDPYAGIQDQFDRLARQQRWTIRQIKRFRAVCYEDELADYMESMDIITPLAQLRHLCEEVNIDVTDTITQCKKALARVNVNLVDLMDARRRGEDVKVFGSYRALMNYTKNNNRFCPKKAAKTDGARVLLKHLTQL